MKSLNLFFSQLNAQSVYDNDVAIDENPCSIQESEKVV